MRRLLSKRTQNAAEVDRQDFTRNSQHRPHRGQVERAREETQASLAADTKFLKDLVAICASTDENTQRDYRQRAKGEDVTKAIEILGSDESHDMFSKSFNPSMSQTQRKM